MKLFNIDTDYKYSIGNGDSQAVCLFDSEIRKSFSKGDRYPEIADPLPFMLRKKARLTDCLSQGGIASAGFLVDQKIKTLLESYYLMQHKYYPAEIREEDATPIRSDYFWLQLEENFMSEIDYNRSVFYEMDMASRVGEIQLESFDDYKQQRSGKGWKWDAKAKQIYLKQNSRLKEVDVFRLFPLDHTLCVSERFKEAIEASKVSGFSFEEYDKIRF